MSQDPGTATEASECSATANPHVSAEDNGSLELGVGKPMAGDRKQLPPIRPGAAPIFVGEKQYDAILRLRERRARAKARRENRDLKVKKHPPRGAKGRFVATKGNQEGHNGGTVVERSAAIRECFLRLIGTNGDQEVPLSCREAQSSSTTMDIYWPFIMTSEEEDNLGGAVYSIKAPSCNPVRDFYSPSASNGIEEIFGKAVYGSEATSSNLVRDFYWSFVTGNADGIEENLGEAAYVSETPSSNLTRDLYWPFAWSFVTSNDVGENLGEASCGSEAPSINLKRDIDGPFLVSNDIEENLGEATTYGSEAPSSNPAGDFYWPSFATNDDEENVGKVAYNSILNLKSPDCTALLRVMMGERYATAKVPQQMKNVARLQAPDFASFLTVMNNAGYNEALDDGHYDVDKVLLKLEGW